MVQNSCPTYGVHDKTADGETVHQKRCGVQLDGPLITFEANVSHKPHLFETQDKAPSIWHTDASREYSWDMRVTCGERMVRHLLMADCEDCENLSASDIHVKRFHAQLVSFVAYRVVVPLPRTRVAVQVLPLCDIQVGVDKNPCDKTLVQRTRLIGIIE